MNIRGGIAVIRSGLLGFLASKGFFWTLALGWMTGPVIYLIVWTAAAAGGAIGGYDRNGFVLYYLCLIVVNQMTYPTTHWSTAESIQDGSVSMALLRPLPIVYGAIACDMATKVVCMPFVAVVVAALGFVFQVHASFTFASVVAALAALMLALVIRFLLSYILSLFAFWTEQSGALLSVNDTFIFLFAGQVAPLGLFPGALKTLAYFLPYRYMVSFPVEVMMGTLPEPDLLRGFAVQIIWLGLLMMAHHAVSKRGVKKYSAVGG